MLEHRWPKLKQTIAEAPLMRIFLHPAPFSWFGAALLAFTKEQMVSGKMYFTSMHILIKRISQEYAPLRLHQTLLLNLDQNLSKPNISNVPVAKYFVLIFFPYRLRCVLYTDCCMRLWLNNNNNSNRKGERPLCHRCILIQIWTHILSKYFSKFIFFV